MPANTKFNDRFEIFNAEKCSVEELKKKVNNFMKKHDDAKVQWLAACTKTFSVPVLTAVIIYREY